MSPLISAADRNLLDQHEVQVVVDANDASGIIMFQGRHFKVTLLTRPAGQNDSDWQAKELEEDQMQETASKIAVMLLKKELLQGHPQPLNVQINAAGFTNLNDDTLIATHQAADAPKDTKKDYKDLMQYIADVSGQEIIDNDQGEDLVEDPDEEHEQVIEIQELGNNDPEIIEIIEQPKPELVEKPRLEVIETARTAAVKNEKLESMQLMKNPALLNARKIYSISPSVFFKGIPSDDSQLGIQILEILRVMQNPENHHIMQSFINQYFSSERKPLAIASAEDLLDGEPRIIELDDDEAEEFAMQESQKKQAGKTAENRAIINQPKQNVARNAQRIIEAIPRLFLPIDPLANKPRTLAINFDHPHSGIFKANHYGHSFFPLEEDPNDYFSKFPSLNLSGFSRYIDQQNPLALLYTKYPQIEGQMEEIIEDEDKKTTTSSHSTSLPKAQDPETIQDWFWSTVKSWVAPAPTGQYVSLDDPEHRVITPDSDFPTGFPLHKPRIIQPVLSQRRRKNKQQPAANANASSSSKPPRIVIPSFVRKNDDHRDPQLLNPLNPFI